MSDVSRVAGVAGRGGPVPSEWAITGRPGTMHDRDGASRRDIADMVLPLLHTIL